MRSKLSASLLVCAVLSGCGASQVPKAPQAGIIAESPTRLIPSDLDVLLRIDLARLRVGLGKEEIGMLTTRLFSAVEEPWIVSACGEADGLLVARRIADLDAGDYVIVAEGNYPELSEAPPGFRTVSPKGPFRSYDRIEPVSREKVAKIIDLPRRARVFVSAAEVASVERVLEKGPDEDRVTLPYEGVVGLAANIRPLPPELAARYPSIAKIIAGQKQLRVTMNFRAGGFDIAGELEAKSQAEAAQALRFLSAIKEASTSSKHADLLRDLRLEQTEGWLHLRWTLPADLLLAFARGY